MKFSNLILIVAVLFNSFSLCVLYAQEPAVTLRAPSDFKEEESQDSIPTLFEVKKLPYFPSIEHNVKTTPHKASLKSTSIPVNTRLRLVVDNYIDAAVSMLGDYFKAHVLEDFYIPTDPPQLVIPKGAWVRGRLSFLKKPSIFSMAGKIGLHLDQLVSPFGEVTLLDAELDIQQGIVNDQGLLDPMTNFGTKALEPTQNLLDTTQGKLVSVVTLGTPVVGTLVTGSLIALFSQGDNVSLSRGQELQVVLKKDIQLNLN